ncbi:glycosyl hydrolase family 88 protein [Aspergillus ambiguus]|uniref:glycoside hydrolase family 88 protein n=1 Tax=Aspergillus ambiguus TaxID=176160 RepID=UPI003CCD571C
MQTLHSAIDSLYCEAVAARIWYVASKALDRSEPPTLYPEYTGKDGETYIYRHLSFWTSGFFPGSLYLLLERRIKYSGAIMHFKPHALQHQHLCQWWTENLHQNALLKTTHDLGFMIAPWAIKAWELYRDARAFSSLSLAAHSLAGRFCPKVGAIRSWDTCVTKRYSFTDPSKDYLVIIDNMINLDMIFWVARETSDRYLYDIAVAHARTTQKHHIRPDGTTYHVVNFGSSGLPKEKLTNQGLSDESCWARGQSWGILGFAQTFHHTGDVSFLKTAKNLADYFIKSLPSDGVPYWDFDAPVTSETPRDTSAGMIASCGMLLIYKACKQLGQTEDSLYYLQGALRILEGTVTKFTNPPTFRFVEHASKITFETYEDGQPCDTKQKQGSGIVRVENTYPSADSDPNGLQQSLEGYKLSRAETILTGATINNYEFAPRRWANHGLVYADYYFILLGNMLLDLGLIQAQSD